MNIIISAIKRFLSVMIFIIIVNPINGQTSCSSKIAIGISTCDQVKEYSQLNDTVSYYGRFRNQPGLFLSYTHTYNRCVFDFIFYRNVLNKNWESGYEYGKNYFIKGTYSFNYSQFSVNFMYILIKQKKINWISGVGITTTSRSMSKKVYKTHISGSILNEPCTLRGTQGFRLSNRMEYSVSRRFLIVSILDVNGLSDISTSLKIHRDAIGDSENDKQFHKYMFTGSLGLAYNFNKNN